MTTHTRTFAAKISPAGSTVESREFDVTLPRAPWEAEQPAQQDQARPTGPAPMFATAKFGGMVARPEVDKPEPQVMTEEEYAARWRKLAMQEGHFPKTPEDYKAKAGARKGGKSNARKRIEATADRALALFGIIARAPITTHKLMEVSGLEYDTLVTRLRWLREGGRGYITSRRRGNVYTHTVTRAGLAWAKEHRATATERDTEAQVCTTAGAERENKFAWQGGARVVAALREADQ